MSNYQVGDRVECNYQNFGTYYTGRIVAVNYTIEYGRKKSYLDNWCKQWNW